MSCYPWEGNCKAEFSHRAKQDKQVKEKYFTKKKGQSRKTLNSSFWLLMLEGSATRGKCKIREKGT